MRPYNPDAVVQLIAERIEAEGRGAQTRLAEALGVRVQTVNKWVQGQTCPEPDRWLAIERALGMKDGALTRASGLGDRRTAREPADLDGRLARLTPDQRAKVAGYIDALIERDRP